MRSRNPTVELIYERGPLTRAEIDDLPWWKAEDYFNILSNMIERDGERVLDDPTLRGRAVGEWIKGDPEAHLAMIGLPGRLMEQSRKRRAKAGQRGK